MDPRTRERVEQWESRPFGGDRDELDSLASQEFSGAVSAAGTWLFVLNGRVVGVTGGDVEDVLDTSGTVYEAPDPALPLLGAMTERGGETRATYYTNKTPLSEVDRTLQEGSFTGYVELSEQVLSGDYYAVYYGGRRMSVAYIGNAERLLTGEEAFDRADDEVGIYEVVDVPIEVTDLPGHESSTAPAGSSGGADEVDQEPTGAGTISSETTGPDGADQRTASTGAGDQRTAGADGVDPAEAAGAETDGAADVIDEAIDAEPTADQGRTTDAGRAGAREDSTDDEFASNSDPGTAGAERDGERPTAPGATELSDSSPTEAGADESGISTATGTVDDGRSTGGDESTAGDGVSESVEYTERTRSTDAERTERPSSSDTGQPHDGSPQQSATESAGTDESGITTNTDRTAGTERAGSSGAGDDQSGITTRPDRAEQGGSGQASPVPNEDTSGITTSTGESSSSSGESATPSEAAAGPDRDESREADAGRADERFKEEERWRETRRIPSIDPETTTDEPTSTTQHRSRTQTDRNSERRSDQQSSASRSRQSSTPSQSETESRTSTGTTDPEAVDVTQEALRSDMLEREDKIDQLTQRVTELEGRRDELEAARERLAAERDELREENEELSATAERLRSRIDELETELDRLRTADATATAGSAGDAPAAAGGTQLDARQALAETNVFVRYGSKSEPTLVTAHDGDVDRETVGANLRLERHTGFDAASAVVDGRPYDEFVEDRMEYRFLDWLVRTLLYEIRETGHADQLADLYDVIPRIDRVELDAAISLADDDTEDVPDEVRFDVVAFDKRGTPLVVANCNDARDPASREMLESIERDASAVNANYPELGAAFVVTSSFFDPGALDLAETATSGGFLSRGSKLSYVNLSRKQGYHLCLVEARSGGFHLTVPEL